MRFGSVCSGIEAASVAWHPLGWTAAWLAEIEKFPSAVLQHHYPDVPNLGDMTQIVSYLKAGMLEAPDVLVGGTPCQAFSVAGLRNSLEDDRGQLTLTYIHILDAIDGERRAAGQRPAIALWENVPGVLNTKDNAFGCLLSGLAGLDDPLEPAKGKWPGNGLVVGGRRRVAWVTLDAQYFGVPQRRRRVFVLAVDAQSVADSPALCPSKILSIGASLRRDTPTRRKAGEEIAGTTGCGFAGGVPLDVRDVSPVLTGKMQGDSGWANYNEAEHILPVIMAHGQANAEIRSDGDPPSLTCNHEAPIVSYGIPGNWVGRAPENGGNAVEPMVDVAPCQTKTDVHAVAFKPGQSAASRTIGAQEEIACTLEAGGGGNNRQAVCAAMQVRRLTTEECEILQGFPPGYTNIRDNCPDGPRYKALGNSMAVPVMRWIGGRIDEAVRG